MVNLSRESRRLFEALGQTDPPLYAIFFVILGFWIFRNTPFYPFVS